MLTRVVLCVTFLSLLITGQPVLAQQQAKKTYDVPYMEKVPYGVTAWAESERVKKGIGKETRFVPYNSDSAKGFVNDVNTLRDLYEANAADGRETSFYMAYNEKGWSIFIHCKVPDIQQMIDDQKDVSLELYFAPGQENVPYYQMMIRQLAGTANFYDWGTPHKNYRSLQGSVKIESLALEDGVGTFMFVPWDRLYDQLPLNGESWMFSFMRWDTRVTWGGNVHNTGSFGLVKFEKPSDKVTLAIRSKLMKEAVLSFNRTSAKLTNEWGDEKIGDLDFNSKVLQPLIASYKEQVAALGDRSSWTLKTVGNVDTLLKGLNEFDYMVADAREKYLREEHIGLAQNTLTNDAQIAIYPIKALTAIKRLPTDPGDTVETGSLVSIVAAKGEFEPASFLLKSSSNIPAVELRASDLTMGQSKIAAENVDIKIVKLWYQGGTAWYSYFADPHRRELTPELLLNDETLIKVDRQKQDNYLRVGDEYRWVSYPISKDEEFGKFDFFTEPVEDSKTLKPIELIKDEYKQIWVTVKVPADSKAGLYQGKIDLMVDGQSAGQVTLAVKVLPYELPLPKTYYDLDKKFMVCIYGADLLRLKHVQDNLTSEEADKMQRAIYKNVLEHGVYDARSAVPLAYSRDIDKTESILRHELRLMKEAGFSMKPLITRGWVYPASNETEEQIYKRIDRFIRVVEEEIGHRDIYLASWDEASVARVKEYRHLAEYVQSKGVKMWVTTHVGKQFPIAGYVLDMADNGGAKPSRDEAARWHALDAKVGSYATPHLGVENPDVYRRWEGMARYKANFDISYNHNYMSAEGNSNIWNEANAKSSYRSFAMVYPAKGDVIDTIAWEGFREGIDDIRYATKLKQDAAAAIASNYYPAVLVAKKALLWLEVTDDQNVDLNTMRLEMINQIEKIAEVSKGIPK